MIEFKLPDIGEGTVEGEIVRWLVEPGAAVTQDQPVVEVMTDKATVELTAPRAGVVVETRAEPGAVVAVGSVIYVLDDGSSGAAPAASATTAAPAEAAHTAAPAVAAHTAVATGSAAPAATRRKKKPLATPATRRIARELGVDLYQVTGTGPAARITTDDVRAFASGAASAAPVAAPASAAPAAARQPAPLHQAPLHQAKAPEGEVVEIPFRGIRKATAVAMVRSKFTATHFCYVDEVDVTKLVALRQREKARLREQGTKLSYLPFIMKAAIHALKKHPELNAELDEANGVILQKRYYHLGISIQADRGLLVGVIRDADRKSIVECADDMNRVIQAVRDGKAKREDVSGSTFTITSAGNIGGLFATPIINFPEVAIMGVHQIKKRPVIVTGEDGDDEIAVRSIMYLSLSVDHRVVDGASAAEFMNTVVALLEDPTRLLLGA